MSVTGENPGIGSICGDRASSQASTTCRSHWTPGADRDGPGGLFPRPPHVRGEREPLVRLQARSGAPRLPVHPAEQLTVVRLA